MNFAASLGTTYGICRPLSDPDTISTLRKIFTALFKFTSDAENFYFVSLEVANAQQADIKHRLLRSYLESPEKEMSSSFGRMVPEFVHGFLEKYVPAL